MTRRTLTHLLPPRAGAADQSAQTPRAHHGSCCLFWSLPELESLRIVFSYVTVPAIACRLRHLGFFEWLSISVRPRSDGPRPGLLGLNRDRGQGPRAVLGPIFVTSPLETLRSAIDPRPPHLVAKTHDYMHGSAPHHCVVNACPSTCECMTTCMGLPYIIVLCITCDGRH